MKILVLNYEYPPLGGGAGVISRHISEGLATRGHHITVITAWFDGLAEIEYLTNLKIIRLKSKRKFQYRCSVTEMISWIRHSWKFLETFLKTDNFDLCFANFALPGGIVALHIKNKFQIPYVVISHGHDIPWFCKKEMFWYHLLLYGIIKKICLHSELNFVQTREMKLNIDKFTGIAKQKKNVIILNGCDIEAFPRAEKKSNKEFILLFSGRLVKQKDPFTFLNALKILLDNNIPFKAKIIGDGIMRKDMEAFVADHKLGEHVLFSGWISKGVMADELRAAAIMVQTSLHEAMSISIMEAMACGTYVICTPVGMNKDLIFSGETGDIFAVGNARQLAEKIESFYYDKFLAGFSISSEMTSRFQQAYDWKKIVPQYEDYFISVLNLKQSP